MLKEQNKLQQKLRRMITSGINRWMFRRVCSRLANHALRTAMARTKPHQPKRNMDSSRQHTVGFLRFEHSADNTRYCTDRVAHRRHGLSIRDWSRETDAYLHLPLSNSDLRSLVLWQFFPSPTFEEELICKLRVTSSAKRCYYVWWNQIRNVVIVGNFLFRWVFLHWMV